LIKQVVDALSAELPHIRNFATLSPIPGLCRWIDRLTDETRPEFLDREAAAALAAPDWPHDHMARPGLRKPLLRLCARYLTGISDAGLPIDPVARFHLGNGASVERINWAGDLSDKGLGQSAGIMVNYRYDPDQIVANHEAFVGEGKIAMSSHVKNLL
jgi:malonyl-CoA decarboxylase